MKLSLALLVTRIVADDEYCPPAADNLALIANTFNAGSDFHRTLALPLVFRLIRNDPV
jgi:hypothetical protein